MAKEISNKEIKKLDEYFNDDNYASVEFIIIPDSFNFMKELGYKCKSKRYVIDCE